MPNFQSDAAAIRASGYSARVYASAYVPQTPVASGNVAVVPGDLIIALGVNYTGGSYTAIQRGMEVVITDPSGNFKGRTHVPFSTPDNGPIDSAVLPVRELSLGTIDVQATDLFAVYPEYRLHDKLVAANVGFDPDYATFDYGAVNFNLHPPPWANSGGAYASFVDVGQTYATVQMTGSTSFTVDPASTHGVTHLWTLPSGVAFQSGSANTDADPVLQVNVGQYVIDHAVTDVDNGNVTVQHVVLICHDLTHMPYAVFITNDLQADENYNWRYTMRLFENATLADLPDGTLVILWTLERNNGAWQSFRNAEPGRSTILHVGYLHADTNQNTATISPPSQIAVSTFDVVSPLQRLDEIAGYGKAMQQTATPAAWSQINTLTTTRAMLQLLQFYTTWDEAGFDLVFDSTYVNYVYPTLYLDRSTPIQQLRQLAHGVDARICCDRTGRMVICTHPKYIPLADRAGITVSFIFQLQDIIALQFVRTHYNTVEQMKVSGLSAGSSPLPYFSLYPGDAPNEASAAQTVERIICDATTPQSDLNDRAGRYGADLDQIFIDTINNGVWYRAFQLKLTLRGSYDFADYYCEYFQTNLTSASNLRGVDLSVFRYWLVSAQVTYDGKGNATTTLTLQAETNAPAGRTYLPPPNSAPPVITPAPVPITFVPTLTYDILSTTYNFVLFDAASKLFYGDSRLNPPPWTPTDLTTLSGWNGSLLMFILNAFSTANGVVATTTKAFQLLAYGSSSSLANAHSFGFTTLYRSMQSERGDNGLFVCVSYLTSTAGGSRFDVDVTLDAGATWTQHANVSAFGSWPGTGGDNYTPGCYVFATVAGKVLTSGFIASSSSTGALFVSTDNAATWTRFSGFDFFGLARVIHCPFQNENVVYHGGAVNSGGHQSFRLFKSTPTSQTDISPQYGGESYGPFGEFGVKTCDANSNYVLCIGQNWDSGHTIKFGVFLSTDGGSTWAVLVTPSTTLVYTGGTFAGDTPLTIYLFGDGVFAISTDGGATISDKSGDLVTAGSTQVVNIGAR